ncbi:hypothetical protein DdX_11287 [Ditylenchus destructor]|uniref:Uncharacterized protein n=1 Tax=Ditylenchus destructor TaxID=166010 RepID=A0AAD4N0I0_9BILA|nr:hypothetical protein DdX_11287 [Ditylenchus destructor]
MTLETKTSKQSLKKRICIKTKRNLKKIASVELSDSEDPENPEDVEERIQNMELLKKKLNCQRNICAFGVIFIVAFYFLIWYNSECWALPFQESPCKRIRDLPLFATNQSTLAEAVDEFTIALRAQIAKFQDGIHISNLAQRQALSNATKNEIRQLFSQHDSDLIAFAELKREDATVREMLAAMSSAYAVLIPFLLISTACMGVIINFLGDYNKAQRRNIELASAEENKNSQNVRLKKLNRQICNSYIATFVCIAAGLMLFFTFTMGHYYSGSSPAFIVDNCDTSKISNGSQEREYCPFIHFRNYSTKLEAILNRHFGKLDSFMASSILEVRQTVWLYESDVIDAAIENHLELKQFNVDRRTMPPEIPQNHRYPPNTGFITANFLLFYLTKLCLQANFCHFCSRSSKPQRPTAPDPLITSGTMQQQQIRDKQASKPFLTDKTSHKNVSIDLNNSREPAKSVYGKDEDSLDEKLEVQLSICTLFIFILLFTVALYFLIWYNSECWALPFQETPCKQPRALPLIATDQSTLADSVDEFTLALRIQIAKFRDTIEMSNFADRQALSNTAKNEIGQLFSNYSADLIAFRALKREDERLKKVKDAIEFGYVLSILLMFLYFFPICVVLTLISIASSKCRKAIANNITSADDPLKWRKRCVNLLYFVIFICIAAECVLFYMFVAGQYYGGTSPVFPMYACKYDDTGDENNCPSVDYLSYSTKLQTALNKHIAKLDSFMASAIELRQGVWLYEIDAIEKTIESHMELKQYDVDRRTMPRRIGYTPPSIWSIIFSLVFFVCCYFALIDRYLEVEGLNASK